ncbi:MAG: FHA domain-containing protein [Fuerstiella sp.]
MKVVLELQDQPSNIKKVTVRHDIVIGRGAECNLRLSAPQVSRRHCFLRISADSATVTDLDSSNGTFLNGRKLPSGKRCHLEDGARLSIGPVQFTARVLSEAPAGAQLQVAVNDDRIEAESAAATIQNRAASSSDMTEKASAPNPDSTASALNLAIESGGPSAVEDEPTSDYATTDDQHQQTYLSDRNADKRPQSGPAAEAPDFHDPDAEEPATISVRDDSVGDDQFDFDVVDVVDDDGVIELSDDSVHEEASDSQEAVIVAEVIEDDEVVLIDEEDVEIIAGASDDLPALEDDEVLVFDDDDPLPTLPDDVEDDDSEGDSVENELRNFLKGLD